VRGVWGDEVPRGWSASCSLSSAKSLGSGQKQTYGLDKTHDEKVLKAREEEKRWARIVGNDLENIPITCMIFSAGVLAHCNPTVHAGFRLLAQ
jgi:hypothetical protein